MGFLNLFKKKETTKSNEIKHIDLPSEPKTGAVDDSDFTEPKGTLEPIPPEPTEIPEMHPVPLDQAIPERAPEMPVEPEDNAHNAPNTAGETKVLEHELPQEETLDEIKPETTEEKPATVEDDNASFEIPDFSDDDLDIDIDVNEFKPDVSEEEVPETQDTELPKFEVSSSIDLDNADSWTTDIHAQDKSEEVATEVPAEITEEPEPSQEEDLIKPFEVSPKKEIVHEEKFIEQGDYIEALIQEDEFKKEAKKLKTDMGKIQTSSAQEEKIYDSMTGIVAEIKDAILSVDAKLFTER